MASRSLHSTMLKSNWQPLTSSQRSVLVNVFSNDLDNWTEFVGGTTLDRTVVTSGGRDLEKPRGTSVSWRNLMETCEIQQRQAQGSAPE